MVSRNLPDVGKPKIQPAQAKLEDEWIGIASKDQSHRHSLPQG